MQNYHETLGAAVTAAFDAMRSHAVYDPNLEMENPYQYGGIRYGESKNFDFPLESYRGKPTKKFGHINVWRDEKGTYEVNAYVL
jgi:hypothetical protein